MAPKYKGYEFWEHVLKSPKYIVAPMVDQSELPWRLLSRRYGAQLCYTPMIHAGLFVKDLYYRKEAFHTCDEDRPLIVQFCANDPELFLKAAQLVEPYCDGVDLNLGCPQIIAKRGNYGAFLQDKWELIASMVSLLNGKLSIPVTCKIRVFDDLERTVAYAKMLEKAGCQLLTVHGRTRNQKGPNTGLANWDIIKAVKESVSIPVFANGNIRYLDDVGRCMEYTGVDGVMTAEGNLSNPALFSGKQPPVWEMSDEYLALVDEYPCLLSYVRGHLFRLWRVVLDRNKEVREILGAAKSITEMKEICMILKIRIQKDIEENGEHKSTTIPYWRCQPYIRSNYGVKRTLEETQEDEERAKEVVKLREMKKALKKQKVKAKRERRWDICTRCEVNPKGMKCSFNLCRVCCRDRSEKEEPKHCSGHRIKTSRLRGNDVDCKDLNFCAGKDMKKLKSTETLVS
ncbi:tRNA-dihydrouridine(16/17) synthase [NAD(P)(+)]-like [Montipora foliosa]|uniref:tRNA-dihydrouridine(16/17) synthase [NAD(P)(+)]-like n=1 Tax=Montipora foliosa TaxID=591990 RepID=UPI0035F214C1